MSSFETVYTARGGRGREETGPVGWWIAVIEHRGEEQNLRASWKSRFQVKCPYCGDVHKMSVRDAYLDEAIDIVGRPARPRKMRKRTSG